MQSKKLVLVLASVGAFVITGCNGESSISSVLSSSNSSSAHSSESIVSSLSSQSSSTSSSSSVASSAASVTEDPHKYDSVNIENPISSTIPTTSTVGYKYGRDLFDDYMTNNFEYSAGLSEGFGKGHIPSRGESKMLVVPVLFSGTSKTADDKDSMRSEIYKTFFGEASDTGWQSVRSYYYESSYHQLYLEGSVSPCVTMTNNYDYYSAKGESSATNTILSKVYKALFTGANPIYKVSDFDSNKDGVIDGIYMVNEAPVSKGLGWAFTTWYSNTSLDSPSVSEIPTNYLPLGTYAWSSIDFATRRPGYTADNPDAHTYIHESGHMLGLNDYYDSYNSVRSPAGGGSMQDYNICDHESYSKYLWGWTSPTVITNENTEDKITVSLKPFEDSGDCVVLAGNFNNTSLDEYLMIDYYTPTKLNALDSSTTYESAKGIDGSGIRIWHVDKRVYDCYLSYDKESKKYTTYFDPNASEDPKPAQDIHVNDGYKPDKDYPTNEVIDFFSEFSTNSSKNYSSSAFYLTPELELMRSTYGTDAYSISDVADSDDLFKAGSTFGKSTDGFKDFAFYSVYDKVDYNISADDWAAAKKVKLPYSITVDSVGDTASITFNKLS